MSEYVSDRERRERALPGLLLLKPAARAADPFKAADRAIMDALRLTAVAPFEGLDARRGARLYNAAERDAETVMRPIYAEEGHAALAFLAIIYWLEDALEAGSLFLLPDSPADRAITMIGDALEEPQHADLIAALKAEGTAHAQRIGRELRAMGYFPSRRRAAA